MRRPVRVKTVLFPLSVDSYFLAEPPPSRLPKAGQPGAEDEPLDLAPFRRKLFGR